MGRKTLYAYLFSIIAGALFFGIIVNEFLPRELFLNSIHHVHEGAHNHEILPRWLQIGSAVILTLLMINGLLRKYVFPLFRKFKDNINPLTGNSMNFKTIKVEGMTCNHCKMTVETNLKKMPGISEIKVDLTSGDVIIHGQKIDLSLTEKTITGLGYKFKGVVNT
jgi:uncharacterized protein